jgi:hypothetical protein
MGKYLVVKTARQSYVPNRRLNIAVSGKQANILTKKCDEQQSNTPTIII